MTTSEYTTRIPWNWLRSVRFLRLVDWEVWRISCKPSKRGRWGGFSQATSWGYVLAGKLSVQSAFIPNTTSRSLASSEYPNTPTLTDIQCLFHSDYGTVILVSWSNPVERLTHELVRKAEESQRFGVAWTQLVFHNPALNGHKWKFRVRYKQRCMILGGTWSTHGITSGLYAAFGWHLAKVGN